MTATHPAAPNPQRPAKVSPRSTFGVRRWAFDVAPALLTLLTLLTPAALAQNPVTLEVPTLVGFKAPIGGEGGRTVALVSGREAKPSLTTGQTQITDFRLETYRYAPDRETELIVESPVGFFGPGGASSDRELTLRSTDGRFAIQGTGWSWRQASGLLVISNAVRTALRRTATATNRPPVEIVSRRFEYDLKSGDARFLDECVASEPGQARVSSGALISRLQPRDPQPQFIAATNGVLIELLRPGNQGLARGADATYQFLPEGERIELHGSPSWRFGPGEGSADTLLLFPALETYIARGNAHVRLQPSLARPASADRPPAHGTPPPPSTPASDLIDIRCHTIESSPREIVFTGPVLVTRTNRLELHCDRLVARLDLESTTGRSSLQRARATGQARARLGVGPDAIELAGDAMDYSLGEHPMIEVTGSPTWRTPDHQGWADAFVIHPEVPTFQSVGHVRVLWQAPGTATNVPPIELTANRLVAEAARARFDGSVAAHAHAWDLTAGELALELATNRVVQQIVARNRVALDFRVPPPPSTTNPPPSRPFAALFDPLTEAARLWQITAADVHLRLGPRSAHPSELDATGGVQVRHVSLEASGGRATFRDADGLFRLHDRAELRTIDGLEVLGEPATALAVDPATGRFRVEGAVRRMTLPVRSLRAEAPLP